MPSRSNCRTVHGRNSPVQRPEDHPAITIDRRTLAAGAVWATTGVAFAAAPARAASEPPPTVTVRPSGVVTHLSNQPGYFWKAEPNPGPEVALGRPVSGVVGRTMVQVAREVHAVALHRGEDVADAFDDPDAVGREPGIWCLRTRRGRTDPTRR